MNTTAPRLPRILLPALFVTAIPVAAAAQPEGAGPADESGTSGRRTIVALRLDEGERVELDGRLDEAFWARAEPASDFIQRDPQNGALATESTEVRIVYTQDALYIGAMCYDSEPDQLIAFHRRRDDTLQSDDRFVWIIDPFLDGRSGYFFETNPAGIIADALVDGTVMNRQWDGIWDVRVHRSDIGWSAEVRLPFRTVNFDPGSDRWGINFERTIRRKEEYTLWSGWLRNQSQQRMANAGLVTGLQDITQGLGLEVRPFGIARTTDSPGREGVAARTDFDGGIDVSYSVTPGFRAIVTARTDFAQTEVDSRQTNLTRFSLFFPERREFFLDGSPYFEMRTVGASPSGSTDGQGDGIPLLTPFFSRRIGLSADLTPQAINVGAKGLGQIGAQDVGLLHVQTANEDGFIGEDFTVARVRRRLLSQSHIGMLYTRRAPRMGDAPTRQTAGGDMRLGTTQFRGSSNLEVSGFFLKTSTPGDGGRNAAFGADVSYPNDLWSGRMLFREVQERFDPAVGFSTRNDYRLYAPSLYFSPRPRQHSYVRRVQFGADAVLMQHSSDATTLLRTARLTLPRIELHSGDSVQARITPTEELLDTDFPLGPVLLPAGSSYRFTRYQVQAQTATRRAVSATPLVEWGGFYSGTRLRAESALNLRIRTGLLVFLSGEWNRVRLPEAEYRTTLFRVAQETQFSPRVSLVNNVQYDTQSTILGWQARFRWIVEPGNDLYVVYSHNWRDDPGGGRFSTLDRSAATKFVYTRRF